MLVHYVPLKIISQKYWTCKGGVFKNVFNTRFGPKCLAEDTTDPNLQTSPTWYLVFFPKRSNEVLVAIHLGWNVACFACRTVPQLQSQESGITNVKTYGEDGNRDFPKLSLDGSLASFCPTSFPITRFFLVRLVCRVYWDWNARFQEL